MNKVKIKLDWTDRGYVVAEQHVVYKMTPACEETGSSNDMSATVKEDCLNAHNEYRARHENTPSMKWSDELAQGAKKWADKIAADGKLAHCPQSDRKGQGENLACFKGITGRTATDKWYSEIKDFDFGAKTYNGKTGHFTQVVWKESVELGAAIATAANGAQFCVARYRVAGNLMGAFEKNIGDLKGQPAKSRQPSVEAKVAQPAKAVPKVSPPAKAVAKVSPLQKECLDAHNDYRSYHKDTPCMIWSDHLASEAMKWASKIAADEKLAHCPSSARKGQGENIACRKGEPMTGKFATDLWYAEKKDFDFGNKTFGNNTGHFTQVVWKESIQLGAAVAVSPSGIHFCVARYSVPGNIKGGFERNIGDPLSKPQDKQEMEKLRRKIEALQSGKTEDGKKPTAQSGDALKQDCLNAHNEYRAKHKDTPNMRWSEELAQGAQKWANHLAAVGKLSHCPQSDRKGQGENIACVKGKPMTGRTATDQWYAEIKDFDFKNKVFGNKTGHFTQVVWKESVELGAATATSSNGFHFCVARYRAAGNFMGAYEKNIGDLK